MDRGWPDGCWRPVIARRHGISRLTAEVLASHAPMQAVFQRCGLPLRQQRPDEVLRLSLESGAPDG